MSLARITIALSLVGAIATAQSRAQSSPANPTLLNESGNKKFDVASIKRHPYDPASPFYTPHANFPLIGTVTYNPQGGLLMAENMPVRIFVSFAYKLSPEQAARIVYPTWALNEHFDIEARGPANATGDDMRLMMQSLLADRFRLVLHWETRVVPAYLVVLARHGKLGPNLQPYSGDPCPTGSKPPASSHKFAWGTCGLAGMKASPNGGIEAIGRSMPIQELVAGLRQWAGTEIDRPLVDGTGLSGLFDYDLTWTPESPTGESQSVDSQAPSYLTALREQLGLKLEPTDSPVRTLVLDHIEEPSPN